MAVADAFDAITSNRIYRPAKDCQAAVAEIVHCSGSQFDPEVVEALVRAAQTQKDAWPVRGHGRESLTYKNTTTNSRPGQLLDSTADEQHSDEWLTMQGKIEQALAGLAESLDKLSASRSQQDLDTLEATLDHFRTQAEELSSLAKSASPI